MANIIDCLEKLGQDSRLRHASKLELQAALAEAGIEPTVQAAITAADRNSLETQAGAASNVCCLIHTAEDGGEDDASVPPPSVLDAA